MLRKRGSRVSRDRPEVHEWCEKEEVMYAGRVLEYMSASEKRESCISGSFWSTCVV